MPPVTTYLLIRHATCDPVGHSIAGRAAGISLNAAGRTQAAHLAERLREVRLDAIYSSPIDRATQTATCIAAGRAVPLQLSEELTELDFSDWTGRSFPDLAADPQWQRFNQMRSMTRASSGELMLQVQSRAVALVEQLRAQWPAGRVALVSHGDLIRSLIAHVAGIPLDLFQRLVIDPGSVSVIEVGERHVAVRCLNVTDALFA